jgi:hypothetical protein
MKLMRLGGGRLALPFTACSDLLVRKRELSGDDT